MKDIEKDMQDMLESYGIDYKKAYNKDYKITEYTFTIGLQGYTIMASNIGKFFVGGETNGTVICCNDLSLYDKAYLHLVNNIKRAIKDAKLKGVH